MREGGFIEEYFFAGRREGVMTVKEMLERLTQPVCAPTVASSNKAVIRWKRLQDICINPSRVGDDDSSNNGVFGLGGVKTCGFFRLQRKFL